MEQENKTAEGAPVKIKAMRRQPCPCGSGKVFKNCHEGDPGYEVAKDPSEATAAPPVTADKHGKQPGHKTFQVQNQKFGGPAARNTGVPHRRKV
jgi:hypothetical protein